MFVVFLPKHSNYIKEVVHSAPSRQSTQKSCMRGPIMMLDVFTNEYTPSVSETMHSELEKSPVVGPGTHVEPTNSFLSTADRWH